MHTHTHTHTLMIKTYLSLACRRYPQIYEANQKLLVSPETVRVERQDFLTAAASITPASHRWVLWGAQQHDTCQCHSTAPIELPLMPLLAARHQPDSEHSFPRASAADRRPRTPGPCPPRWPPAWGTSLARRYPGLPPPSHQLPPAWQPLQSRREGLEG